jgi:hypothetical protein
MEHLSVNRKRALTFSLVFANAPARLLRLAEHPLVHAAKHERHFFGFSDQLGFGAVATYARGEPNWFLTRRQINQVRVTFSLGICPRAS